MNCTSFTPKYAIILIVCIVLAGGMLAYKLTQDREVREHQPAVPVLISENNGVKIYRLTDPAAHRYVWYAVGSNNQPVAIAVP